MFVCDSRTAPVLRGERCSAAQGIAPQVSRAFIEIAPWLTCGITREEPGGVTGPEMGGKNHGSVQKNAGS
jgi:hypothetical protein